MTAQAVKEHVARTLTAQCQTHEEWLAIVRYGLPALLEDQSILIELILREAEQEAARRGDDRVFAYLDYTVAILQELGLRFVCSEQTASQ